MAAVSPAPPTEPVIPAATQLELDRLRAIIDFPLADRDILYMVNGDAATIRKAAEKLHVQAQAIAAAPAPAPPASNPPQPPAPANPVPAPAAVAPPAPVAPVPVPGTGTALPAEHVEDARKEELRRKVELRIADPYERDEAFNLFLRDQWNEHVAKLNARPGRS